MNHIYRFHAEWCGPCRVSLPAWETFKSQHSKEFIFEDVDIDSGHPATEQYNIMSIPAIVISNEEGVALAKRIGTFNVKNLEELSGL